MKGKRNGLTSTECSVKMCRFLTLSSPYWKWSYHNATQSECAHRLRCLSQKNQSERTVASSKLKIYCRCRKMLLLFRQYFPAVGSAEQDCRYIFKNVAVAKNRTFSVSFFRRLVHRFIGTRLSPHFFSNVACPQYLLEGLNKRHKLLLLLAWNNIMTNLQTIISLSFIFTRTSTHSPTALLRAV